MNMLDNISGCINSADLENFKRIVFRVSKGNVFSSFMKIDDNLGFKTFLIILS